MFELFGNIVLLVFTLLIVWLYFKTKRQFPRTFIWILVASNVFSVLDLVLTGIMPVTPPTAAQWSREFVRILIAVAWIAYMRRSRRVRNTFVS
jgi:hypothetical protein